MNTWEIGSLRLTPTAGKAMDYMLERWDSFARFFLDSRICLSNDAVELSLRGMALGRKAWLFARNDRGDVFADRQLQAQ
jgi:transposase